MLTLVTPCPPAKVFHPAITDTTGALYWAKLLMEILDQKLDSDCQGRILAPQPHSLPKSVEQLLQAVSPGPGLGLLPSLGSVVPLVSSAVSQLLPQLGVAPAAAASAPSSSCGEGRAVLRGWLSEQHTRDLVIIATNINTIKDVSRLQRLPTVRSWTSP